MSSDASPADQSRRSCPPPAERARQACIAAALAAFEDAKLRGLCGEGAFELAIEAMRQLDLATADEPADEDAPITEPGAAAGRRPQRRA